jgi:hypothetical protein
VKPVRTAVPSPPEPALLQYTPTNQTLAQLFNCIAYLTVIKELSKPHYCWARPGQKTGSRCPWRVAPIGLFGSVGLGPGMVIAPLAWPRVAFPLISDLAIYLGKSLCYRAGTLTISFVRQLERSDPQPSLRLLLASIVCGGLWEFWNYWAYTKWLYAVT